MTERIFSWCLGIRSCEQCASWSKDLLSFVYISHGCCLDGLPSCHKLLEALMNCLALEICDAWASTTPLQLQAMASSILWGNTVGFDNENLRVLLVLSYLLNRRLVLIVVCTFMMWGINKIVSTATSWPLVKHLLECMYIKKQIHSNDFWSPGAAGLAACLFCLSSHRALSDHH